MSAASYYPAGAYYDKRAPWNEPIYSVRPKDYDDDDEYEEYDEPEYEPDYDEMAYERMMEQ